MTMLTSGLTTTLAVREAVTGPECSEPWSTKRPQAPESAMAEVQCRGLQRERAEHQGEPDQPAALAEHVHDEPGIQVAGVRGGFERDSLEHDRQRRQEGRSSREKYGDGHPHIPLFG
jgi:hypothetical protein